MIPNPTSPEIAIGVDGVGKTFKLPHEKSSSIKSLLINFRKRRTFERQQVFHDISFDIKKGEFFGIVGRNGSGKSTLLKLLAGIYVPTKGQIHINGKLTPFIELGVGFNPELTGKENVYLNGALLGFSRSDVSKMYDDIVAFAELEKFMDQKLKNYSSGMQVRLAFSIAIRAETDILLIDEVLAVGDQSFQQKCYEYFASIKKSDKTVVFVTHDMSSVERFCDRVLLLDKSETKNGLYEVGAAVVEYNRLNFENKAAGAQSQVTKTSSNKPVFIKKISVLDAKGKPTKNFTVGDKITFRVELGAQPKTPKDEPYVIGIGLYDVDNVNIAGPNSLGKNFTLKHDTIEYTLDHLPLNMGEYRLTVGLFDSRASQRYDISDREVSFFVNTDKIRHGKVILDGDWKAA